MYSETLTAKEQDANNFLSVAGSTYYSFTNVAPNVTFSVVNYLGEAGALLWLDRHTSGDQRLVKLTPEQVEELETVSKWSAKRFFTEYSNKFQFTADSIGIDVSELDLDISKWIVDDKASQNEH